MKKYFFTASRVRFTGTTLEKRPLKNKYTSVGLISTLATAENRVYEERLQESGISFMTPNGLQKAEMDKIILRLIEGRHLNSDREKILEIIHELSNVGLDCIALACTDLQLL